MWKKKKGIKARAEYEEGRRTFHVVAITSSNDGRAVSQVLVKMGFFLRLIKGEIRNNMKSIIVGVFSKLPLISVFC